MTFIIFESIMQTEKINILNNLSERFYMKNPKVVAHYIQKKVSEENYSGIKWLRVKNGGGLYFLRKNTPSMPLQFWKRLDNKRIINLTELAQIKTKHSTDDGQGRGEMSYPAPLYSEVVEQIPQNLISKVKAFEVVIEEIERSNGYDTITTILYTTD